MPLADTAHFKFGPSSVLGVAEEVGPSTNARLLLHALLLDALAPSALMSLEAEVDVMSTTYDEAAKLEVTQSARASSYSSSQQVL